MEFALAGLAILVGLAFASKGGNAQTSSTELKPVSPVVPIPFDTSGLSNVKIPEIGPNGSKTLKDIAAVAETALAAVGGAIVGAKLGSEIDKIFGGDGKTGTGIIAQVGVGGTTAIISAGVVAAGTGSTLPAIAFIASFAWPIAGAFFAVGVAAFAIGSAISDSNRLAYGQSGAEHDFRDQWETLFGNSATRMRATQEYANVPGSQIQRLLIPFTDGYMYQLNYNAFRRWMSRGHGLTVGSDTEHLIYGRDRGYFVGSTFPLADGTVEYLFDRHILRSEENAPYNLFWSPTGTMPNQDVVNQHCPVEEKQVHRVWTGGERFQRAHSDWLKRNGGSSGVNKSNDAKDKWDNGNFRDDPEPERDSFQDKIFYKDPTTETNYLAGRVMGNFSVYLAYMQERSKQLGDAGAVAQGIRDGEFEGEPQADGSLKYNSILLHWRDMEKVK